MDPKFKQEWIASSGHTHAAVMAAVKTDLQTRYRRLRKIMKFIYFILVLHANKVNVLILPVSIKGSREEETPPSVSSSLSSDNSSISTTAQVPPRKKIRSLFSSVVEIRRSSSVGPAKVLDEFEVYIREPTEPFCELANQTGKVEKEIPLRPLQYWKRNSRRFPILAKIAKDLFGVPASSGSIERVFSTATDIMCAKRNRIKPDFF